jgi:hypothetical protein
MDIGIKVLNFLSDIAPGDVKREIREMSLIFCTQSQRSLKAKQGTKGLILIKLFQFSG